jgi:hypothetical protein
VEWDEGIKSQSLSRPGTPVATSRYQQCPDKNTLLVADIRDAAFV